MIKLNKFLMMTCSLFFNCQSMDLSMNEKVIPLRIRSKLRWISHEFKMESLILRYFTRPTVY